MRQFVPRRSAEVFATDHRQVSDVSSTAPCHVKRHPKYHSSPSCRCRQLGCCIGRRQLMRPGNSAGSSTNSRYQPVMWRGIPNITQLPMSAWWDPVTRRGHRQAADVSPTAWHPSMNSGIPNSTQSPMPTLVGPRRITGTPHPTAINAAFCCRHQQRYGMLPISGVGTAVLFSTAIFKFVLEI